MYKPDALMVKMKRDRMERRLLLAQVKVLKSHWITLYVTQTDLYTSLLNYDYFSIEIRAKHLQVFTPPADFTDRCSFK